MPRAELRLPTQQASCGAGAAKAKELELTNAAEIAAVRAAAEISTYKVKAELAGADSERLGQLIETMKADAQRQSPRQKMDAAVDETSEDSTPSTPTEQSPHEATEALHRVLVEETAAAVELHVGEAQVRDAHAKKLEVRSRLPYLVEGAVLGRCLLVPACWLRGVRWPLEAV